MSDQNAPILPGQDGNGTDDPAGSPEEGSWLESVAEFDAEATWLTPADRPQVKALYSIARELDKGTFQAALISQFTLVHRALLARRPTDGPVGSGKSEEEQIIEMMKTNPAAFWKAT